MIYRVDYWDTCEGSQGYEYFGNKKAALCAMNKYNNDKDFKEREATICCSHKTPRNKQEILQLLNMWASHPNNG